jgi:uncharacterized protein (DUF1501 family)
MNRKALLSPDRRDLLKGLGALGASLMGPRAFAMAAGQGSPRLLVVFLRGAYDAINAVIPTSSDFYYESRPDIAIARPDPGNPDAASPLTAEWGLHPVLRESIGPLWQARQIAFVPFAGSTVVNRSHFAAQDVIELGQPAGISNAYGSGFLGRLASVLKQARPISFTGVLPLCFDGGPMIQNLALGGDSGGSVLTDADAAAIAALYGRGGTAEERSLDAAAISALSARRELLRDAKSSMKADMPGGRPTAGFERIGRQMARLMKETYNLGFVDIAGWDTHVKQGGAKGAFATNLGQLGRGLAAFVEEIGPDKWRDTTVVVLSEFGRTFRQNGDRGTDHGYGSIYWVLGGSVAGGRIVGPQDALSPKTLHEGRELPVLTDYRSLLAGIFQKQYGLTRTQNDYVFPRSAVAQLGLL